MMPVRAALSRAAVPGWLRWFWRIYVPAVVLILGLWLRPLGGVVEGRLFPILAEQRIEAVSRTPARLCWLRSIDKRRMADAIDLDVRLERPRTGDRSYPEVFAEDTGVPWHRNGALAVGPSSKRFCVQLPPDLAFDEPIVLSTTIRYRGLWGLWAVTVDVPDIVDPPR